MQSSGYHKEEKISSGLAEEVKDKKYTGQQIGYLLPFSFLQQVLVLCLLFSFLKNVSEQKEMNQEFRRKPLQGLSLHGDCPIRGARRERRQDKNTCKTRIRTAGPGRQPGGFLCWSKEGHGKKGPEGTVYTHR
jgi:hypothetical protein